MLVEEPVSVGCLVAVRLVGVIEAKQAENGKSWRNDRLIGVAAASHLHKHVRSIGDVNPSVLEEIERFFVYYNEMQDRTFKVLGRYGAARALKVIREGKTSYQGGRA